MGGNAFFSTAFAQKERGDNKADETLLLARTPTSLGSQNQSPATISDGNGGAWLIWQSYRQGAAYANLYLQRVGTDGKRRLPADGFALSTCDAHQTQPRAVPDGKGGLHVVWVETRYQKDDERVFYVRVDKEGNTPHLPTRVCAFESKQVRPALARLDAVRIGVLWEDGRAFSQTQSDLYAAAVDTAGVPRWAAEGVAVCTEVGDQTNAQVLATEGKAFVCIWEDLRQVGARSLFAQRISTNGVPVWENEGIPVAKKQGVNFRNASMLSDGLDGFVCAFEALGEGTLQKDVYITRINRVGLVFFSKPIAELNYDQFNPQLAASGPAHFIVAWQDTRDIGVDLFVKRFLKVSGNSTWHANGLAVCTNFSDKSNPRLIPVADGARFFAVWEDNRNDKSDLYAQFFSADATLLWDPDGVPICKSEGAQKQLDAAPSAAGFWATWVNETGKNSAFPAYQFTAIDGGLQCGANGSPLLDEQDAPFARIDFPVAATGFKNDVFIVWEDYRNGKKNSDIYVQRIDEQGKALWRAGGLPICTAENLQSLPTIQTVPGGAYIAWIDRRNNDDDLYIQFIDTLGRRRWKPNGLPLCNAPRTQNDLMFARRRFTTNAEADTVDDGVYAVWTDGRHFYQTGFDVYIQAIEPDGKMTWGTNGRLVAPDSLFQTAYQSAPSVCEDGVGGVYVVWTDERSGDYNIFAQRFDFRGDKFWSPEGICVGKTYGHQRYPVVKRDPISGRICVLWADDRLGFLSTIVMLQIISPRGELFFKPAGKRICEHRGRQSSPELFFDNDDGLITAWIDQRYQEKSGYNLYTQRLDRLGGTLWRADGVQLGEYLRENNPYQASLGGAKNVFYTWRQHISDQKQKVFLAELNLQNGAVLNKIVPTSDETEQVTSSLAVLADGRPALVWVERAGPEYRLMFKIFNNF